MLIMEPAAALFEAGERFTAAVESAGEVGGDEAIPLFDAQFGGRAKDAEAGIINKDVEGVELFVDIFKEFGDLPAVADVGDVAGDLRVGYLLCTFDGVIECFRSTAAKHYVCTVRGKGLGDGEADAL